ncbi:MAG: UTRA domain-containing protein [Collinsella sp.]
MRSGRHRNVVYRLCSVSRNRAYDYTDDSLFRVIRDEYGVQAAHGVERLSITRLNEREADLLSAEVGTPAFFEQCFNQDSEGSVVEYCRAVNRDRFNRERDDSRSIRQKWKVLE